jgi:heme oxygenase
MTARALASSASGISLFDARPFFEKTLQHGVQHGIIDQPKLDAICQDAPKGMVQIARYFGTEFLRPELEKAKDRMVNLVSLYLEDTSGGDLRIAAQSLRDHSFLSRSKGGSDMLKQLIAMPQHSHFGMHERAGFNDDQIPLLAKWSLRSYADYRAELAQRSQVAQVVDAALWLANSLGMDASELEEADADAESLVRTALLSLTAKRSEMPDWVAFEKMLTALRKKGAVLDIALPKKLPEPLQAAVLVVRESVLTDLEKLLDPTQNLRKLLRQTPAFMGRYFWREDALSEVDQHERATSKAWDKATGGHDDEGSLLTLLLCLAAGATGKTLLSEKGAAALIRKIRKSGLEPELAAQFIREHAPAQHQGNYLRLWKSFLEEGLTTLQSDADYALHDALALLRRECNVG